MPDGDKIVTVLGVGNVQFPGTMDDASINQAIEQHLAASQPGAMQATKGGPILNAKQVTPPAPSTDSDNAKRIRGATMGLAEGAGIQPSTNGIDLIKKSVGGFGSSVGDLAKGSYGEWQEGLQKELPSSLKGGFGQAVTRPVTSVLAAGMTPIEMIARIINNSATSLEQTGSKGKKAVQSGDLEGLYNALGSGVSQLAMLRGGGNAASDPIGKAGLQKAAQEIVNEGPSKARVLADQHAHALDLQKHIAGVEQAVHTDAQQAMAQVASKVDSAHPDGAFDKGDVGNRLNNAIGDTLSDKSQLPKSVRDLLPKEAAGKQPGPTIMGKTLDLAKPEDLAAYQRYKAGGLFTPEQVAQYEGKSTGNLTFEELKQKRSDLGKQMQSLEGPAKAAASAAYGELSQMLREGAKAAGVEPDWIDANAKWKGYLDDFHRSPIQKTLFGENAHDIMDPLTGKSRVQVLDTLSKYEPFGIDMDKINTEVRRSGVTNTVDRLSRPGKMDLIIAGLSPKSAALRAGVPRVLRNPKALDFLAGGKGFDAEAISPKKVYPNKAAAAADLKGNPTPFGGGESELDQATRRAPVGRPKPLEESMQERRSAEKATAEEKRQAWEKAQEAKRKGDKN